MPYCDITRFSPDLHEFRKSISGLKILFVERYIPRELGGELGLFNVIDSAIAQILDREGCSFPRVKADMTEQGTWKIRE